MKLLTLLVLAAFSSAYFAAVVMLVCGTLGLLGHANQALANDFLVPLGRPWNRLLATGATGERAALGAISPLVNIFLLWLLYRMTTSVGD